MENLKYEQAENDIDVNDEDADEIDVECEQVVAEPNEWDDILGSGALMKKVLIEGEQDNKPKRLMICKINYKCSLEDGTIVEEVNDAKIQLGDLEVIQGLDLAIALMNVGETCQLYIQPRLAYGDIGLPGLVGPHTSLLYEVDLLSTDYEKEEFSMSERKKLGNIKKKRGNWWYERGECTFAIQCYRRAMEYLDDVEGGITDPLPDNHDPKKQEMSDAALQDLLEDRVSVHNNMAAAQMKLGAHDAALQSLQSVLRCQPNNVKALYRKSKVLKAKNEIPEAMKCLQRANALEPDNAIILKEMKAINVIMQKQKNYEKELAKRMFNSTNVKKIEKEEKKSKSLMWASIVGSLVVGLAGIATWRLKFS